MAEEGEKKGRGGMRNTIKRGMEKQKADGRDSWKGENEKRENTKKIKNKGKSERGRDDLE